MASSYQLTRQESEEEDSSMTALMRSTGEEIEANCKNVRGVIVSQNGKKRNNLKV